MPKNFVLSVIAWVMLALFKASVTMAQPIPYELGFQDSIQSTVLNEKREYLIHLPTSYATSTTTFPVVYLLDGTENGLLHVSALLKHYFRQEFILVAVRNTDRDRDMMPLNVPSYPVAKPGAENFLNFLGNELIPKIERSYRTNGQRTLCGQSLSGVFAIYVLLTRPLLFDSYLANSAGWFADMDYFFSPLVDKAFQHPEHYKGKRIFIANSENDSLDPNKEILKSMEDFTKKVQEKLGDSVQYKYETYTRYGHVPYPALFDGFKFIMSK